jgi:uncharacterized protein (DUF58 family)
MEPIENHPGNQLNSNLELLAKYVVEGFITGLHKSPFHGFSVEFAEHRAYNSGDNIKNIDWKLFGKTEKLYTKRYEEETNLRCQFVIDTSSSMFFPQAEYNKLNFSVESTAALIYLLRKQRDAFGLSLFTDELWLNTPARSTTTHQQYVFAQLEQVLGRPHLNVGTNLERSLHQVAESIHQRSMVIIFSDLLSTFHHEKEQSALFAGLQHLKFNKHEVIIFSISDKAREVDFAFDNRPYHFIDMETGAELKANSATVKESYLNTYQAYRKQIALTCAQYKIDLVEADISEGFSGILTAYLIKRKKMN